MKSKMMMLAVLAGATALYGQNPLTTELKQNYAQVKALVTKAADDMPWPWIGLNRQNASATGRRPRGRRGLRSK